MPKLLVIADDLSGATDVGAQLARRGVQSFVAIHSANRPALSQLFSQFEVVLVNIESRHVAADEARLAISELIPEARSAGVEFFYKKTDSTLRGNVGAELDVLLKASCERTLCFVPAHPALGRTTYDGVQLVHGTPLHESSYAHDARNPVRESRVVSLLEDFTETPVTLVRQRELAAFASNPPAGIIVFDAETEADVINAASAIHQAGRLKVLAGSAALASTLSDLIPFERRTPNPVLIPSRLLFVNGSLNEVALRQCAEAEKDGVNRVRMSPIALLSDADDVKSEDARHEIAQQAVSLIKAGRDVLLASVKDLSQLDEFKRAARCVSVASEDWPERIAFNTGRIVERILLQSTHYDPSAEFALGITVIGGDTLAGVARANGWKGFLPRGELLRGVAVCEVAERPGLIVTSKPGGFGDEQALCAVRRAGTE